MWVLGSLITKLRSTLAWERNFLVCDSSVMQRTFLLYTLLQLAIAATYAGSGGGTQLLSPLEAESIVRAEREAREASAVSAREALLAEPALEERVSSKGSRTVVFREIARAPVVDAPAGIESSDLDAFPSNEVFNQWAIEPVTHEHISLAAHVYDDEFTEIAWRNVDTGEVFTVWTNVNLNYLRPMDSFGTKDYHYDYFGFVYNYNYKSEVQRMEAAEEAGFRTEMRWKIAPVVFSPDRFEYFVDADEGTVVPDKLYRQLDAMFSYYLANKTQFEIQYKNSMLVQAVREEDLKKSPSKAPETIIINYTPLRGVAAQ